jgi:hypothetical protein
MIPPAAATPQPLLSIEETFFEKSLSLHICGLHLLLSFLLPERSELTNQLTHTGAWTPLSLSFEG